jgi:AcrR family transcriptional regulator
MNAREAILDAAFPLFLAHGYDGTGMTELLGAAGVSKGAFYHHFASKQAVYEAVVAAYYLAPWQALDWGHLDGLPLGELIALLTEAAESLPGMFVGTTGRPLARYFSLYFECLSRLPDFRDEIQRHYLRLIGLLARNMAESRGLDKREANRAARDLICVLEGRIYLAAIIDGTSAEKGL